jgi:lysozyme
MSWFDTLLAFFKPKTTLPPVVNEPLPIPEALPAAQDPDAPWIALCMPLTKASEGCKLTAYPDPASGGDPWTIGYGATGAGISKGVVWTQAHADQRLEDDLRRFGISVDSLVHVPLMARQKAALVDFTYNVGPGSLGTSTLLRKLNDGDFAGAADQFPSWNIASGKVMSGLVTRRMRERSLFLTGDWK